MTKDINFESLLDKYMFHVSRNTGGTTFVGDAINMRGFSLEEIAALTQAHRGTLHDADLYNEMNGLDDAGEPVERMDEAVE